MQKQQISSLLRSLHLSFISDKFRYYVMKLFTLKKRNNFRKEYPQVVLPPDYLMYESFQLDYRKYFVGGKEDAKKIIDTVKSYINLSDARILDWGCGPARIVRHLPDLLSSNCSVFGTDYNKKTISWCQRNIENVTFSNNGISPPLGFPDNYFTLIYGISILTHLSRINQSLWSKELNRIISPAGIVLVTTHGEAFKEKLTKREIETFDKDELVSRANVLEGHRMYGAFHPPEFIKGIFIDAGFEILKHIPGKRVTQSYISQDIWLLKKKQM